MGFLFRNCLFSLMPRCFSQHWPAKRITVSFFKIFYNSLSGNSYCLFIVGFGMYFILHQVTIWYTSECFCKVLLNSKYFSQNWLNTFSEREKCCFVCLWTNITSYRVSFPFRSLSAENLYVLLKFNIITHKIVPSKIYEYYFNTMGFKTQLDTFPCCKECHSTYVFTSCIAVWVSICTELAHYWKMFWKCPPTKALAFCWIWAWSVSSLFIPNIFYLIPLPLSFPLCPILGNSVCLLYLGEIAVVVIAYSHSSITLDHKMSSRGIHFTNFQ